MKLFLVERHKEWFEQCKSFVVAAQDEGQARRLAYEASIPRWGDEDRRKWFFAGQVQQYAAWTGEFLDADECNCTEIVLPDAPAIIHSHYTGS